MTVSFSKDNEAPSKASLGRPGRHPVTACLKGILEEYTVCTGKFVNMRLLTTLNASSNPAVCLVVGASRKTSSSFSRGSPIHLLLKVDNNRLHGVDTGEWRQSPGLE